MGIVVRDSGRQGRRRRQQRARLRDGRASPSATASGAPPCHRQHRHRRGRPASTCATPSPRSRQHPQGRGDARASAWSATSGGPRPSTRTRSVAGPSAIETQRAPDVEIARLATTRPPAGTTRRRSWSRSSGSRSPLTVLWILLGVAARRSGVPGARRARGLKDHPYADKRPVADTRRRRARPTRGGGARCMTPGCARTTVLLGLAGAAAGIVVTPAGGRCWCGLTTRQDSGAEGSGRHSPVPALAHRGHRVAGTLSPRRGRHPQRRRRRGAGRGRGGRLPPTGGRPHDPRRTAGRGGRPARREAGDLRRADDRGDRRRRARATALAAARPGDSIELEDGVYEGRFVATASGHRRRSRSSCAARRRGPRRRRHRGRLRLHLDGAEHWRLVGFTVRNGQKGVMADGTSGRSSRA